MNASSQTEQLQFQAKMKEAKDAFRSARRAALSTYIAECRSSMGEVYATRVLLKALCDCPGIAWAAEERKELGVDDRLLLTAAMFVYPNKALARKLLIENEADLRQNPLKFSPEFLRWLRKRKRGNERS